MSLTQPTQFLCPTDLSETSARAVHCGLTWARLFGARASILHARELVLPPRYFTPEQMAALSQQAEAMEEQVRADVEDWVRKLGVADVPFEVVVGPGPADRAILRAVELLRPDLVVMGTHGRSGFNRFLMGSTAEKVVRQIPVPVLTLRQGCVGFPGMAQRTDPPVLGHILCAADDPRHAGRNLETVATVARRFRARLTVLHSLESPHWLGPATPGIRDQVASQLRERVAEAAADLEVRVLVTEGPAYLRILEEADRTAADLIVVGGREPKGDAPVFGSTAIRVMRHAARPVLALPGRA
jgi:nucleotide-binding universal stress UspA family protein